MIFSWTKQFLIATGFFAMILAGQTVNMVMKEKRLSDKQLDEAHRTVRVTHASSQLHLN